MGNLEDHGYALYNSSDTRVGGENYNNRKEITFTTTSDTDYILFSVVYSSESYRYDLQYFRLDEEPLELNAIGDYKDHIRKGTGKNLISVPTTSNTANGVTASWSGNHVTVTGTNTKTDANYGIIWGGANFTYPDFKVGETYTLSAVGKSNKIYLQINYFVNGSTTQKALFSMSQASLTFTIPDDYGSVAQIFLGVYRTTTTINENFNIQLEKGPQATYFEPYGYENKWYLEKQIGKVVLNGTESWNIESSGQRYTTLVANSRAETQRLMIYSNYFHYSTGNEVGTGFNYGKYIYIYPNSISSIADLKTWLGSHNTIIYYMLATSTFTEITDENLISQLETLSNSELYEGTTNILSYGNLPAYLNIAYYNNNFNGNFTNFNEITNSINEKAESVQHDLVNNYVQNGTFDSYTESTNNKLDDLDNFKTETDRAINGNNKLHYICNGTESGKYYFTYDNVSYYFTMPTVQANSKLIFDIDDKELKLNDTVITTSNTGTGTELKFVYDDPGLIRTVTESSAWINTNGETVEIVAQTYSTNMSTLNNLVTDTDKMIKNFNFGGDGLTITADKDDTTVNTKMNLNITNESVRIRHGSENMMTLDPEGIHFSEVTFREIRFGDYLFKDEENGGFGFMYDPQNNN